ncbi:hypothetical protein AKJ16_DCAP03736 [Drosera capensis]
MMLVKEERGREGLEYFCFVVCVLGCCFVLCVPFCPESDPGMVPFFRCGIIMQSHSLCVIGLRVLWVMWVGVDDGLFWEELFEGPVLCAKALKFQGGRWIQDESSVGVTLVYNGLMASYIQHAASSHSTKSNIPVWPFLVLSFFDGAYALLPYFILWKPPSAPVDEAELKRWPLNFLESKIPAGVRCR